VVVARLLYASDVVVWFSTVLEANPLVDVSQ
jgi:hypothetical protein